MKVIYYLLTDWAIWPVSSWLPHKRRSCFHSLNKWKIERFGALSIFHGLDESWNSTFKEAHNRIDTFHLVNWDTSMQLGNKGYQSSHCAAICCLHTKLILDLTVLLLKRRFRQILSHVTVNRNFCSEVVINYEIIKYCPSHETERHFLITSHTKGLVPCLVGEGTAVQPFAGVGWSPGPACGPLLISPGVASSTLHPLSWCLGALLSCQPLLLTTTSV